VIMIFNSRLAVNLIGILHLSKTFSPSALNKVCIVKSEVCTPNHRIEGTAFIHEDTMGFFTDPKA